MVYVTGADGNDEPVSVGVGAVKSNIASSGACNGYGIGGYDSYALSGA